MSKTTKDLKAKKAREEQAQVEEQATETAREAQNQEEAVQIEKVETNPSSDTQDTSAATIKTAKTRSKQYKTAKAKVDKDKYYSLPEAVSLVKKTSYAKFGGKVEAHVVVTDVGTVGEISFPHLETAAKKIAVLDDKVLAAIKDGNIDFDILIATPATMPKLLPYARLLGPKGLMPNPKSGTLTDKPQDAVKKLSAAKTVLKTEKKAPVLHLVTGQVSQPEKELVENIDELIKTIGATKIKKLVLKATMGPAVKVAL